jgi:hypothetical protein
MERGAKHFGGESWRPIRPAVGAPPNAAPRRGQYHLAVCRIERHPIHILETAIGGAGQLQPIRPTVVTLEDTGASDGIRIIGSFTGARIEDVRVKWIHHHAGDGEVPHEIIQRKPARPAVYRLPHATVHATAPHHVGLRRMNDDRANASPDVSWSKPCPICILYSGVERHWVAEPRLIR